MRIFLRYFLVILFLVLVVFFLFVPKYVDQDRNTVEDNSTEVVLLQEYNNLPFIADLHCDALLWDRNLLKRHDYGHVDIPRMIEANVALQIFTIVSKSPKNLNIERNNDQTDNLTLLQIAQLRPLEAWFNIRSRALEQCNALLCLEQESKGQFRLITSQQELGKFIEDRSKNKNITSGMLGLEGAHCLKGDLNALDEFYKKGVRYIGIAHFFDNEWGGSAHGEKKGGLTSKGKELIQRMNQLNITIDLAHASSKTIDDILSLTQKPVLVSHTGVQGICNNVRNLSDQHLLKIGENQGLVGIGLWETAVCGTDAYATAKSIRYVADKIGVDKVALGSDFDGNIKAHFDITHLPLIMQALIKEGFSSQEIEQIMGGNIRDFFLKNLPEKD